MLTSLHFAISGASTAHSVNTAEQQAAGGYYDVKMTQRYGRLNWKTPYDLDIRLWLSCAAVN